MLDRDGYPTDETLARVRTWDAMDCDGLFEFLQSIWYAPTYIYRGRKYWHVSTAGWSGNEDLMQALSENHVFWALWWQESKRGGHYKFRRKTWRAKTTS